MMRTMIKMLLMPSQQRCCISASHISVMVLNQTLGLAAFEIRLADILVEGMRLILSSPDYITVGSWREFLTSFA